MEIKNIEIQDSDGNVFYPHTNASVVKATDTSGLDGIAGKSSDTQTLLDKLADRVANKLIEKGMIANNLVTDNENMVLAAPMGKKLQEQISDVNKNIINNFQIMQHRPYNSTALNEFNIDNFAGNWIAGFTDVGEGTFPEKRWQNIVQFDTGHFENQISMQSSFGNGYLPEIHLRSKYAGLENQSWTNWNKIVTNSDLQPKQITEDELFSRPDIVKYYYNWTDQTNFPCLYGTITIIPTLDPTWSSIQYVAEAVAYFGIIFYQKRTIKWNKIQLS